MKKGLMLLMLAAMLLPACADTNSNSRNRNSGCSDRPGQPLCDLRRQRLG